MTLNERQRALLDKLVRYGIAGLIGTGLYAALNYVMVEKLGAEPVIASVIATTIVMLTSYVINRVFVFKTNRSHASSFTRFAIATGFSMALTVGLTYFAVHVLSWGYVGGIILVTAVIPPTNFLVNYLWAFRHTTPA